MLVYFMTIWNILWPFGIIYGRLVYFVVICYIFTNLVCLDQEKSVNPDWEYLSKVSAGPHNTGQLWLRATPTRQLGRSVNPSFIFCVHVLCHDDVIGLVSTTLNFDGSTAESYIQHFLLNQAHCSFVERMVGCFIVDQQTFNKTME
jgi:hypothetical protein